MTSPPKSGSVLLNVLILEDRPSDAELMVYELRQAGFEPCAVYATSEHEFLSHLNPQLDVILADYTLPGMGATRALECLHERGLEVPLVVVSGSVGEETALAALRLGAADYILKDRLLRLGPAIYEILEKKRLRQDKLAVDQAIRDRERRFRTLIEHSIDGLLVLASDGTIVYASTTAARILLLPIETLVGKNALSFIAGKSAATFARRFQKLVTRQDEILTAEFICRRENHFDLWLEATVRNLLHEPAVAGIVANFRDITRRVDNERQLAVRAQQLDLKNEYLARSSRRLVALNAAAHQNIANVSHDFRTPLTVLGEFCSLLREGHGGLLSAQQHELTTVMASRIDDLALMVENMLDSSASEAGIMLTFRQISTIGEIIKSVPTLLERQAAGKQVALHFQIPEDLPAVFCDPEKFQRVVVNLAVNALKFTPPGGQVELWARNCPQTSRVIVGVSDNGPGIAAPDLKVIFDRFRKLEHSADSTGFGLGLNITAEFVRLNLGTMNVASVVGKGSTFSFSVPHAWPALIFERFLNHLQMLPERAQFISLLVIGNSGHKVRCRKSDLEHLLRLRLHGNELAYPRGETEWCLAVPFGEDEAIEFVDRLRSEWMHLRKNCLARELPDLEIEMLGSWRFGENDTALAAQFCSAVSRNPVQPIVC